MLTEEEVDRQIACHMYIDDDDYISDKLARDGTDLCPGAVCPCYSGSDSIDSNCKHCIGDYEIKDLAKIQPKLNWKNLKDTILMAQVLDIKSISNK